MDFRKARFFWPRGLADWSGDGVNVHFPCGWGEHRRGDDVEIMGCTLENRVLGYGNVKLDSGAELTNGMRLNGRGGRGLVGASNLL